MLESIHKIGCVVGDLLMSRKAAVMFQGTGSDVGKSLIVAGLGRAFLRRGFSVCPFKSQNMSNNAAVTPEGGEIGRAQALQAKACGLAPHSDMNPILLKPQTDIGSQVIVQGRVFGTVKASDYRSLKPQLLPKVLESFSRLQQQADIILVEGAGSAAEVNLRQGDIANMGFAEAADLPVILIGDIDRGGVLASLVGTHALLPDCENARIKGYLINRFRGDITLFSKALDIMTEATTWPSLGVLPWFEAAKNLPAEDSVALERPLHADEKKELQKGKLLQIVVLCLPRIANFDDLDPLKKEPSVSLTLLRPGQVLPGTADLVILPGSKATLADLEALREAGWDIDLYAHIRRGGHVLGLCGGYQMLGRDIMDPYGIEGDVAQAPGLDILDITTTLGDQKTLTLVEGKSLAFGEDAYLSGYEMHMGQTTGTALSRPLLVLKDHAQEGGLRPEGVLSQDQRICGSYVHGLLSEDGFRHSYLNHIRRHPVQGKEAIAPMILGKGQSYEALVEETLESLADHIEAFLDVDRILAIARGA